MKKQYTKPGYKVVTMDMENNILTGSATMKMYTGTTTTQYGRSRFILDDEEDEW